MEATWATMPEAMNALGIRKRQLYKRMKPGNSDSILWKPATVNGRPSRMIYVTGLPEAAQRRLREHRLAEAVKPAGRPGPAVDANGQLVLIPPTPIDEQVAALKVKGSEREVVLRRLDIVRQCLNFNWKANGFHSKRDFLKALAEKKYVSARSIRRWTHEYKKYGNLDHLAKDTPGPPRGTHAIIDLDMRAHLQRCWIAGMNQIQCFRSLRVYLEGKQNSPGCSVSHIYRVPSYPTVARYIRKLSVIDHAAREGADALKAARGYIDRSYDDLSSGEMWCIDEWNVDAGCYDDNDARQYYRPWIITLLDARSRFILSWCSTKKPSAENVLTLVEGAMRKFGRPDYFYSDKGGHFRGRLGRRFKEIDREKMLGPAASILEQLGVVRRGPGAEKNPRANPLERRHRIFADAARLLPTWCGPNTDERPERFDQQWKMHEEWISGKSPSTGLVPLTRIHAWFEQVVDDYNHKPSGANGLKGLSPAAAYQEFASDADRERRKLSEGEITLAFAEMFEQRTIQTGGIIELKDGMRYSHPSLLAIQGQKRDVKRSRNDRSYVIVLPAWKGEEPVVAVRRERVGHHDPEKLSQQVELLASIKKTVIAALPPAPPLAQVMGEPPLPVRRWRRWTSAEVARKMREIEEDLTPEKPIKALDFADIENEMSEPEKILTPERLVKARDFADLEN